MNTLSGDEVRWIIVCPKHVFHLQCGNFRKEEIRVWNSAMCQDWTSIGNMKQAFAVYLACVWKIVRFRRDSFVRKSRAISGPYPVIVSSWSVPEQNGEVTDRRCETVHHHRHGAVEGCRHIEQEIEMTLSVLRERSMGLSIDVDFSWSLTKRWFLIGVLAQLSNGHMWTVATSIVDTTLWEELFETSM